MIRFLFVITMTLQTMGSAHAAASSAHEALWSRLREGGYVVLVRHAGTESGIGDPPGFKIDNCSTQRNLSAAGREDARRIGAAFRSRAIPIATVLSSQWCRCIDTAHLAFGRAQPAPMLNSMFNDDEPVKEGKKRAVHSFIAGRTGKGNLILVTHAANIQALTGVSASSGEMIAVLPDGADSLQVVGRLDVTGS